MPTTTAFTRIPFLQYAIAVARLKVNGGLDGTFGKQGRAYADFFDGNDTARDVVLQSNGKIVVVGDATERGVIRMGMARFING